MKIRKLFRVITPYYFIKTCRITRISLFLLLIILFQVNAKDNFSQISPLSFSLINKSIEEVIEKIEQETEYSFLILDKTLDINKAVNIEVKDQSIEEVLNKLFSNTDIQYQIADQQIVLMKKEVLPAPNQENKKQITGIIVDELGEAIIGANVVEKGTINGVVTDTDGKFILSVPQNAIIEISYIGYITQEISVRNRRDFKIQLEEDTRMLEDVVIIGYGKNSRRDLTSSVATVDADKLQNVPVSNVTMGLAGRAAGLIVSQSGAGIGKTSRVSIRGGGDPLIVIDGFISPYDDFENLNPNDIESMTILKDAAAAAVYGARAGDGVIVIQTKEGSKGLRVNYSFNQNWSQPTYLEKKLDSYDRAVFDNTVREMYKTDPRWTAEEIEKFRTGSDPYNYPNVDWQKVMLRKFAPERQHSVTLRGGTDINKFYVSFQAYDQESMYKQKTDWLKRYNIRMNETADFKDLGLKLNFGLDGYIVNMRSPRSQYGNSYFHTWSHIQNRSPMELDRTPDGNIYIGYDNPLAETSPESGYSKTDYKMITGSFNAEWDVYKVQGLKLKAGGNYRFYMDDNKTWNKTAPQYDLEGNKGPDYPVSLSYSNGNARQYTLQFFADYNRSFLNETHNVGATAGYEQTYAFSRSMSALRKNYIFIIDQMGAGPSDTMENSGSENELGRAGLVGRLSYNYKKKYYIEGSMRHDGSDLFPKGKRWGTFFAGSLAYAISEETFFDYLKERNILNFFKIRASYGEVGLDSFLDRFSYLTSYGLTERGYVIDGQIVPTFSEGGLISEDITWYTRYTSDIGFDFSTLEGRLAGTFDYFFMKTKGYLTSPSNVNYTDPLGLSLPNVKSEGEHRRAGFDFSLSWKDQVGDFKYEVGGNMTYFDELVAVAWNEDITSQKNPRKRIVQQRGYYTIGYKNLGYYQNSDDTMNTPRRDGSSNLVAGDIKYLDLNGDGIIDDNDQTRIGKNGFPRGNYGIYGSFSYKGFSANILFQGATSRDLYLDDVVRGQSTGGYTIVYPYQLDYWMPDNRNAMYPRIAMNSNVNGSNNYTTSDFWLINAKYIRLKTVQVGYNFREKLLKNVSWLYKLELVLSGYNLFTISPATKYGFDPENGSTNNYDYPVQRVFSVSVNLGL